MHVLSKHGTDRCFFSTVNRESRGALKYAGVNGSELCVKVHECTSVSTLELVWNHVPWGKKDTEGRVIDHPGFAASCWNEETRVSQVDTRRKSVRMKGRLMRQQLLVISRC